MTTIVPMKQPIACCSTTLSNIGYYLYWTKKKKKKLITSALITEKYMWRSINVGHRPVGLLRLIKHAS